MNATVAYGDVVSAAPRSSSFESLASDRRMRAVVIRGAAAVLLAAFATVLAASAETNATTVADAGDVRDQP